MGTASSKGASDLDSIALELGPDYKD
jgi:hypothetical protein